MYGTVNKATRYRHGRQHLLCSLCKGVTIVKHGCSEYTIAVESVERFISHGEKQLEEFGELIKEHIMC